MMSLVKSLVKHSWVNNHCLVNDSLFPDRPGMPGIPDIEEVGGDFVSLTWEKPSSDGGGRIIGYIIEKKDANYDSWTRFESNQIQLIYTLHISNWFRGVYNRNINIRIKFRKLQSFTSLDKV